MKIKSDAADKWFSKYIRLRDSKCMRCESVVEFNANGDPISHQAAHYMTRRREMTRYDPINVDTLCTGCHMHFHSNPKEHEEWKVAMIGQTGYDELVQRSYMYFKKDRKMQELIWKQAYLELKTIDKE